MLRRTRWPLPAGLLVALLALPAVASAQTAATKDPSGQLLITGQGSEESSMTVRLTAGGYTIGDSAGMDSQHPECTQDDPDTVTCTTAGVDSVRIDLGPGDDGVTLVGVEAAATLLGGDGDDTLRGGDGPDTMSGGPGDDHVSYLARDAPVSVSLDGQANDGASSEGDDVQDDVEEVTGGSAADVLGGSTAGNRLNGGPGDDRLAGEGGDDALDGGGDADALDGGDGSDTVSGGAGDDEVSGGPGDDVVDGSVAALVGVDGHDRLDGGEGADVLSGGPGIDTAVYGDVTAAAAARPAGTAAGPLLAATVSLDGAADDGLAKEGDNVQEDVENVTTGGGDDSVSGSALANGLASGAGEDFLDGRDGPDALASGSSADVTMARDGFLDDLDCGPGVDFAVVDPRETATRGCEFLDKGGARRPRLGRRFVLRPLRGRRLGFGSPGMARYVPLGQTLVLPLRSSVRTGRGAVRLTSARQRGSQSAVLSGGAFLVKQRGRRGLTQLNLRGGDFGRCGAAAGPGEATPAGRRRSRRRVRRLFGRGRGRFRTRGRHSAATVRGTRWVVVDRCDGTLTRVIRGTVRVRDFRLRRTVVLRAGERYLAKAR